MFFYVIFRILYVNTFKKVYFLGYKIQEISMVNKYGTNVFKPKGTIHKATKEKQAIIGLMRNDVLKYMMQLPLIDFAKKNPQLLQFVKEQFGESASEFTVEMAVAYQNIAYNIVNPNAKDFSYIQAELYGKVKEEAQVKVIELPPMQDDSDILNRLDTKTLERLLNERKLMEAPKETFQEVESFTLIEL